jgi:hypothetical protein
VTNLLELDYYVMTQTYIKGALKGNQDGGARPLRDTPMQKPAASSEMNCLPLISAVILYGLVHTALK